MERALDGLDVDLGEYRALWSEPIRRDESDGSLGEEHMMHLRTLVITIVMASVATAATHQARYYAHEAVLDEHGVIAPWYTGPNGQIDERIRVAAETLKRYPWTPPGKAPRELPEYMWSGAWKIAPDGAITIPQISDWANGDLGQRAAYVLGSLIDYYRYSGEAWAIEHVRLQADMLLDFCLTGNDHAWPRMLISVPTKGKPYGQADPRGFIQLDIVAEVGIQMVRAAHLCGNERYLDAAKHWGDLLAERRILEPGVNPWPRYANPENAPWEDVATGGVAFILEFFDELLKAGYTGKDSEIVNARKAGVAYLRDVLLPNWTGHDTWGRNYWDWPCHVQVENVTEFVARYLMDHPAEFPNWKNDTRNILTLFINRTCAAPGSAGDVFSGAWAYPESSGCCGRSLWYGPLELAFVYGQYAALAESDWAREMARRQLILATYDFHRSGVVEDGIDGGPVVAGDWFKIAHPMALKHCLAAIAWMPEVFAPPGEAHIVRSTHTLTHVQYNTEDSEVSFRAAGLDKSEATTVLRLPYKMDSIQAEVDGKPIAKQYQYAPGGEWVVVTLQHPVGRMVRVSGAPMNGIPTQQLVALQNRVGPTGPQRWIFGYAGREDYVDSQGFAWRPATEWVIRSGDTVDTVAAAWYVQRRRIVVEGTHDPELYRYGAHGKEFWANFTVGPGTYCARLKFAENRYVPPEQRAVTILISGEQVVAGMDIAATAAGGPATQAVKSPGGHLEQSAGMGRAVDLVFDGIRPKNGTIEIRFKGSFGGEAIVQAIEIGPGDGGQGATPVTIEPASAAAAASRPG